MLNNPPKSSISQKHQTIRLLIAFIFVQTYRSLVYNCNTLVTSTGIVNFQTFAVGDTPTFCIHFLPYNVKIGFKVTVDTYQAVSLRRNFEVVSTVNTDFAFQLSGSYVLSQQVVI